MLNRGKVSPVGLLTARHPFEYFFLNLCQLIIKFEMHIYTLILNTYEFIDKIPEKLQGEKRAKTGKNRSKCVSFFVDGISEERGGGKTGRNNLHFMIRDGSLFE